MGVGRRYSTLTSAESITSERPRSAKVASEGDSGSAALTSDSDTSEREVFGYPLRGGSANTNDFDGLTLAGDQSLVNGGSLATIEGRCENVSGTQAMQPSSRTPEGEPNTCPVCGQTVRIEPSRPPGDAPCPHCGHSIWFGSSPNRLIAFGLRSRSAPILPGVVGSGSGRQRIYALARELGLDSKVVELCCQEIGIQVGSSLASLSHDQAEAVIKHAKKGGLLT